jgi:hypothetical protein
MELNVVFQVGWNIVAIFNTMLSNDTRCKALERCEIDFMSFDVGFNVD